MGYCRFLQGLFEDGRVSVPSISPIGESERIEGDRLLSRYDRLWRRELPLEPPPLVPQVARWAGTQFYRACQLAVYRDYSEADCSRELGTTVGVKATPAAHYSVDLVFHYIPDLIKFVPVDDPLSVILYQWARDWPLSSVGVADVGDVTIDQFTENRCLLMLYVDRVLLRRDLARLACPITREAVRSTLGLFPDLAPEIAAAIEQREPQETNA